ncbi:hypothetical protein [Erysipelothrix anatis]|uniref:hypothetical protein n=1 Tax=Erysipelothrix anatis TaxID=2683713 RepID=UPI00135B1C1F|nr:hypothetical protein [Erysipelothrix anatis]
MNKEILERFTKKVSYTFASTDEARRAREVYAYIRKNRQLGYPIYIQNGRHTYTRFENCTPVERANYFRREQAKLKSLYFDTILPIKKQLTADELKELHVQDIFDEIEKSFEEGDTKHD